MTWGTRVRLAGGHLAHYGGQDHDGTTLLAHGDYAWTDTLRPAAGDARDCARCMRKLPGLEAQTARAIAGGIAKRCGCGRITFWPSFACQCGG